MGNDETNQIVSKNISQLVDTILNGEKDLADSILMDWAQQNGYHETINSILEPALEVIGDQWDKEKVSLAAGYLAGKVAEDFLNTAVEKETLIKEFQGTAILGNIEDDYHSLGRGLIKIFLITAGWEVIDLGNDITAESFVEAAITHNADVIGVSAMMYTTALNILAVRTEIEKQNLSHKVKLAVGGAIFKVRPELVETVGGDGTASNAANVATLFKELKEANE